ncbi:MAG: hypothetical protein HY005_02810 [Candidatus Staskawiczbacteria bacterium]|nr:hypothetical protein [Candidatus Staskawiczbacteria bacterium]
MKNIFPKIDKKVLIIIGVILVVVLIAGFFIYKYSKDLEKTIQNNESQAKIETPNENTQNQPEPRGFLTICSDKCGDGICQSDSAICKDNDINCVCAETKTDCPQDCK